MLFTNFLFFIFAINLHRNKKTKRKEKKMYYVFSHVKDNGLRKKIYLCPYFSHIHSLTSKNTSKPNTVALRMLLSLKNTISFIFSSVQRLNKQSICSRSTWILITETKFSSWSGSNQHASSSSECATMTMPQWLLVDSVLVNFFLVNITRSQDVLWDRGSAQNFSLLTK